MGVTLERVQNKFACIIGELCSEPDILSQFAIWVDLRIAEYKSKGYISLDCSGENPNPSWLRGFRPLPPTCSSRERTTEAHDIPRHRSGAHRAVHQEVEISWDEPTLPVDVSERLSPDVVMIKQENADTEDVHPVGMIHANASRKRTVTSGDSHVTTSSPSSTKVRRTDPLGTGDDHLSGAVLEPVHESLMSIIGAGDAEVGGGESESTIPTSIHINSTAPVHSDSAQNNTSIHLPSSSCDNMPSATRGDNSINVSTGMVDDGFLPRFGYSGPQQTVYPRRLSYHSIRSRINADKKTHQIVKNLTNAVGNLERWLWKTASESRNLETIPSTELNEYLTEYFSVVQKHSGGEYTPISLTNLRCLIERYLKEKNYGFSIIRSPEFGSAQRVFTQRRQMLRQRQSAMTSASHIENVLVLEDSFRMSSTDPDSSS